MHKRTEKNVNNAKYQFATAEIQKIPQQPPIKVYLCVLYIDLYSYETKFDFNTPLFANLERFM